MHVLSVVVSCEKFQLTRPRGARLTEPAQENTTHDFNSRARVGRDLTLRLSAVQNTLFQLTRPRGARLKDLREENKFLIFQLTRPRGARLENYDGFFVVAIISTHAPAWGATEIEQAFREGYENFNSRARVGRDMFGSDFTIQVL